MGRPVEKQMESITAPVERVAQDAEPLGQGLPARELSPRFGQDVSRDGRSVAIAPIEAVTAPAPSYAHVRCPTCQSELAQKAKSIECVRCAADWPIVNDVPVFVPPGYPYWGFVPQRHFEEVRDVAIKDGWRAGISLAIERAGKTPSDSWLFFDSPRRTAFRYLLDVTRDSTVLDIGSGGPIATTFATIARRVYAIDTTRENLEMVTLRAKQQGLSNVVPVCTDVADVAHLPLPAGSVDVVILNGVIEWLGLGNPEKNPKTLQLEALRKISEVLRPGGTLYLATENRYSGAYFLGQPEEHTYIRWVSLMPRPIASVYHRMLTGKSFRAYTHSRRAMDRMLRATGFCDAKFHSVLPSYRNLRFILPCDDTEGWQYALDVRFRHRVPALIRTLARLGLKTGLHRHFVPTFAIVARKA